MRYLITLPESSLFFLFSSILKSLITTGTENQNLYPIPTTIEAAYPMQIE